MKKILIQFILPPLILFACSSKTVKTPDHLPQKDKPAADDFIDVKNVDDFFKRCERDIRRASGVIVAKDLVKNLSHLLNMDAGGRKYYLLERDNITSMIKAVTENVYHDFILINKTGTIIYTMRDNSIFGKNVRTHLLNTPLARCYENRNDDIHIEDITMSDGDNSLYSIYISMKVKGDITFPGIFILQLDPLKIRELLSVRTEIIGGDGKYRITHNAENTLKDSPYSEVIIRSNEPDENKVNTMKLPDNKIINYRPFKFKNISWIILSTDN